MRGDGMTAIYEPHGREFESLRARHFGTKTGHSKHCRFCARSGDERAQQYAFRTHDANFFRVDFDALGERAEGVAAVAAALGPHAPAGLPGERLEGLRW